MEFRIGINLGDVIVDGERIYGDGVNVAARIEGLAEAGGICISGSAYDQIKNKLALGYEYLGEHAVKNIAEPVRVYRARMEPRAVVLRVRREKRVGLIQWQWMAIVVAALVGAGAIVLWDFYQRKPAPPVEVASQEKTAFALPDKPSIAVLPFANLSEDPKQEYFADGMTDDLITDLSKISGLFVIARNSVFTYKGKPVKTRQVAEELGVRYVLEGSVRKADNRVRINAQLIDATTGGHLWAERYDGEMGDVLTLQDRITGKIVAALAVKLKAGEKEQIARKYTDNVAAYDAFLQGREHYFRYAPDDFARAVRYFEKAIELDPNYGRAYAMLAKTYWDWYTRLGPGIYRIELMEEAEMYLQKAMNNPTSIVYQVASSMHIFSREHGKAIAEAQRAIALDPNDGDSYHSMAYALIFAGSPKEALDFVEKAMRLDPHYPAYYLVVLGLAQFSIEQFEEAATSFERALKRNPENYWVWFYLAASYGHLGRKQEATAAIEEYKKVGPHVAGLSIKRISNWPMSTRYKNPADKDRLLEGLRKAGLPETFRFWEIRNKTGEK
jgi:TolB-like protein